MQDGRAGIGFGAGRRRVGHEGVGSVGSARRTRGEAADSASAQERLKHGRRYGCCRPLIQLQRPLLNGAINLAQVVDAGIALRGLARLDEVGDGNRSQQANDGHYDHDFHQRETRFAGCSILHYFTFRLLRREQSTGRVILLLFLFTDCPVPTAVKILSEWGYGINPFLTRFLRPFYYGQDGLSQTKNGCMVLGQGFGGI